MIERATQERSNSPLTSELRTMLRNMKTNPPVCGRCRFRRAASVVMHDGKPRPLCGDCKVTEQLHRDRNALRGRGR